MAASDGVCTLCRRAQSSHVDEAFDEGHGLMGKAITLALGVGLAAAIAALVHAAYGPHRPPAPAPDAGGHEERSVQAATDEMPAPAGRAGAIAGAPPGEAPPAPSSPVLVRPVRAFEAARVATPAGLHRVPVRAKVAMYAAPWCYVCDDARAFLQARGVELVEHDVEADAAVLARLRELSPLETLPTFEFPGETLVGFDSDTLSRALERAAESERADAATREPAPQ